MPNVTNAPVAQATPQVTAVVNSGAMNAFSPTPTAEEIARGNNAFAVTMPGYQQTMTMPSPARYPVYNTGMTAAYQPTMPGQGQVVQSPAQVNYQFHQPGTGLYQTATMGPVCQPLSPEAQYWLNVVHDSIYPSQREWAAESLSALDWRANPKVVAAMIACAREDPAPTVRAACVRSLARMKANTPEVISAITTLKSDSDPRVRLEVDQALKSIGPANGAGQSDIQPAGALMPGKVR
jgi:hypothetical protein